MMIAGIGDSNLSFGGHGWSGALRAMGGYRGAIIDLPGGSSRDVLHRMGDADLSVPVGTQVLVALGINDMLQGIGPVEFVRNHLEIKLAVEAVNGPVGWVWMPSHCTGHWRLELLRTALCVAARWHGITFVNLRRYRGLTVHNAPVDPFHLARRSYEAIAACVWQ